MTITIGTYILRYAMYLLYNIRWVQSVSGSTSDAIRYNTHTALAVSRPRYSVDTVCISLAAHIAHVLYCTYSYCNLPRLSPIRVRDSYIPGSVSV